jgi:hypothetical protein
MNTSQEVKSTADIRAQILCSIEDAARLLGIGRSLMYEIRTMLARFQRNEIKESNTIPVKDLEKFADDPEHFIGEHREVKRQNRSDRRSRDV